MGQPSVFPHGTTIYNPEKCWNGYTIVPLINDGVQMCIRDRAMVTRPLHQGCCAAHSTTS